MRKKISDLKFYISYWDFNKKELKVANLFELSVVRYGVARYVLEMAKDEPSEWAINDRCLYVFHDLWSRCEWELAVCGIVDVDDDENWRKVDMVSLFIRPNEELLFDMIDEISVNEARRCIREYRKNRGL